MATVRDCAWCGNKFAAKTRREAGREDREERFCGMGCRVEWQRDPATIEARFWSYVDKSAGPDACWPWAASKDKDGYGKFAHGLPAVRERAHRFALKLTHAAALVDNCACHRCDNPPCCNPAHLFVATNIENRMDRDRKGRQAKLQNCGRARCKSPKVSPDAVRAIRADAAAGIGSTLIALKYGIDQGSASRIANRKAWAWIE